jgi:hypothetical protein
MSDLIQPTLIHTPAGDAIGPDSPGYDEARSLYNAMIDKKPRWIVRCKDAAEVADAIAYTRDHDLLLAVRGGGHNGAGLGSCDDGLVIDLSPMKAIKVDPRARTVRVEPGCTQGEVDHAARAYGLAVPAGIVSSTGIAGLTLGGGHGYLSRRYGLTIDNLIEAEVVLADGRIVRASADENPDLFWGLKGGGGNFGVVTSFLFRAHPVTSVYAGPIFFDVGYAAEIMRWYREFLPTASRDLFPFLGLKTVPSCDPFPQEIWGRRICALISVYNGSQEEGEAAMAPVRAALPAPLMDAMAQVPFADFQAAFDGLLPKGLQWYWKGDFVDELSDAAIAAHVEQFARVPTAQSLMHLYPIDGAVQDVGEGETPWGARGATWSMVIAGIDTDPAKAPELKRWASDYWSALHAHSGHGGAYVNFMAGDEGEDRVRAAYGDNYDALVMIKRKYDPDNLFRVNQNIVP